MKQYLLLSLFSLTIIITTSAQNFDWGKAFGSQDCQPMSIAVDAAGNSYMAGYYMNTFDFDPGIGTYFLTPNGSADIYLLKLDVNGNFLWAKSIGSNGEDGGYSIFLDDFGGVIVTGSYTGTVDFNPGPAIYNLTGPPTTQAFILKLDLSGNFVFAKSMAGQSNVDSATGYAITTDVLGNIYVTGLYYGTIDFDPSVVTYNLTSISFAFCGFIVKFDNSGNFTWAKSIGGNTNVIGYSVAVDNIGNVYSSGSVNGTADFDPSPAVYNLTGQGFLLKLDALGNFQWSHSAGPGENPIALDQSGNVYQSLTNGIYKYDPVGNIIWSQPASSGGSDIEIDASGNIYSTSEYQYGFGLGEILKLNSFGNILWTVPIGGFGVASIDTDVNGNIYAFGGFNSTMDLNPFPGISSASPPNSLFILKLGLGCSFSSSSSQTNVNCAGGNDGTATVVASSGDQNYSFNWGQGIGIAGSTVPGLTAGNYSCAITDSIGCVSNETFFITEPSALTISTSNQTNISCFGLNDGGISILISGGVGSYLYNWSPAGVNGYTTPNVTGLTAGNYDCTITDGNGCALMQSYYISQPDELILTDATQTNVSACNLFDGSANVTLTGGTGVYSYNWSPGVIAGDGTPNVTGLGAGNYDCTVTDANNCVFVESFIITEPPGPLAPSICMVTVDDQSINNIIYWDKTSYTNVDTFIVYRETTANNYERIGAISMDSLSMFVDTVRALYFPFTGDPNTGTYRYKLQLRDNCGSYSPLGLFHNTIYANQTNGTFNWNHYEIEGEQVPISSLSAYELFRDDLSTGTWNIVSAVSGTQTTITDANYAAFPNARWRIETIWNISCEPLKKVINNSRSNIKQLNNSAGIQTIETLLNDISIYPNPANESVTIELIKQSETITIKIINMLGQLIEEVLIPEPSGKTVKQIDLSNYAKGVYSVQVHSANKTIVVKLVKN